MKIIKLFLVCFISIIIFGSNETIRAQSINDQLLDKRIEKLQIEENNVKTAISELAFAYNTPIGLEIDQDNFSKNISVKLINNSLREALELIISKDSGYDWKIINNVINIFPNRSRDEFLEDLLSTRIQHFNLKYNPSRLTVKNEIGNTPAIKIKLENANAYLLNAGFVETEYSKLGKTFSLNASNKSLREILNEIVTKSDERFWALTRIGEKKEVVILTF